VKAVLLTRDGSFVEEVDVPFFITPPGVLVWGQRFFVPFDKADGEANVAYFMEAFVWWCPTKQEEVKDEHTGEGGR